MVESPLIECFNRVVAVGCTPRSAGGPNHRYQPLREETGARGHHLSGEEAGCGCSNLLRWYSVADSPFLQFLSPTAMRSPPLRGRPGSSKEWERWVECGCAAIHTPGIEEREVGKQRVLDDVTEIEWRNG